MIAKMCTSFWPIHFWNWRHCLFSRTRVCVCVDTRCSVYIFVCTKKCVCVFREARLSAPDWVLIRFLFRLPFLIHSKSFKTCTLAVIFFSSSPHLIASFPSLIFCYHIINTPNDPSRSLSKWIHPSVTKPIKRCPPSRKTPSKKRNKSFSRYELTIELICGCDGSAN